jgi:hypothetical protein
MFGENACTLSRLLAQNTENDNDNSISFAILVTPSALSFDILIRCTPGTYSIPLLPPSLLEIGLTANIRRTPLRAVLNRRGALFQIPALPHAILIAALHILSNTLGLLFFHFMMSFWSCRRCCEIASCNTWTWTCNASNSA